jgi:hypothetical protein
MDLRHELTDLGNRLRKLRQDPPAFRLGVAAALLAVGLMGVTVPLGGSLSDKREKLSSTRERAAVAARLGKHVALCELAAPRLTAKADPVDWGDYTTAGLRAAGLRLLSQEAPEIEEIGNFRLVRLRLRAGGSYAAITDFVDRVERGARLMRIDRIAITFGQAELELEVELVGLSGVLPASIPSTPNAGI